MKTNIGWPESSFINKVEKLVKKDRGIALGRLLARQSKPTKPFRQMRGLLQTQEEIRNSINPRLPLSPEVLRHIRDNQ